MQPRQKKTAFFSHWMSSEYGTFASISEFIPMPMHLYPNYSTPWEPGIFDWHIKYNKDTKERKNCQDTDLLWV